MSGHHRIKAAREAGIKEIPILLDITGLSKSQIAAKQLAHNNISGFDDPDMLKEISKLITDVDDMLESYYSEAYEVPNVEMDSFVHIKSDLEFRQISLVFLDHQVEDFGKFMRELEQRPDYIGVARNDQFDEFCRELKKTQKVMDVKNISAAVDAMIGICNEFYNANGYARNENYVSVSKILGGNTCSKSAGDTIKKAVTKVVKDGNADSKWKAMEYIAERYLNGEI